MEDFQLQVGDMQQTLRKLKVLVFDIKEKNQRILATSHIDTDATHELQVRVQLAATKPLLARGCTLCPQKVKTSLLGILQRWLPPEMVNIFKKFT